MFILSKTTSRETIGKLLDRLEDVCIEPIYYRLSTHKFLGQHLLYDDVIRWGLSSTDISIDGYEYNKASAIKLASNKGECRKVLHDNGIPVPEPVRLDLCYDSDFPIIVRPSFHQKGINFLLFNNYNDYRSRIDEVLRLSKPYASRYYPKTTEWRVHVAHGKVLIVQEKIPTLSTGHLNWNHDNGYVFKAVGWKDYREDIVRLAVDTIEVLGLDFGAVDILADPTDSWLPSAVVCEVNTAPKLEGYTADRYAEYFDWLEATRETSHFKVPEGTKPRHYVFKHRELKNCEYDFGFGI